MSVVFAVILDYILGSIKSTILLTTKGVAPLYEIPAQMLTLALIFAVLG